MSGQIITDRQIEAFLALFDNNPLEAVKAISAYSKKDKPQVIERAKNTNPVIINIENISKTYKIGKQKVSALNGATLQIHSGELVAITGASGSGKSTLLQLIGGLDKPTSGVIEVDGVKLDKLRDGKLSTFRNKTIGFVFQFFYLQPFLRVSTNLEVPGMFAGTKRKKRQENINKLAEAVGLSDRMRHFPRELSGGQMQRAAIARALLNNPKILLADEPTGNLDSKNSEAIIQLFEKIRADFGTTVIIVTHDSQIAARADREIRLSDGVVI